MLLATFFSGMQIADLDKSRVYVVPASYISQMMIPAQRMTAKACAERYGVRYRVQDMRASN